MSKNFKIYKLHSCRNFFLFFKVVWLNVYIYHNFGLCLDHCYFINNKRTKSTFMLKIEIEHLNIVMSYKTL